MKRITDAKLDAYLRGKYDWPSLPPQDVKAMAVELRQLRSCTDSIVAVARILQGTKEEEE
jgi:hypothetical protein